MKKALLVIDMQNVSVGKNHASYFKYDCEKLIGAVNGVIDDNRFYIGKCLRFESVSKIIPLPID
ncbi:MAG: hypothetical protein K6G02_00980 [Lactobacillus sp.]|nr:hypothetical protein [Lactobacillus sp.]